MLLITAARQIEGVTNDAFGRVARDSYRRDLTVCDRISLARVSVLGIFAHHNIVRLLRLPYLDQPAMNLVLDARIQFHRADVCVQIEFLSIENYLSESCQLWLRIGLARFREDWFSVNFVSNRAKQDRVGGLALFKRTFGPFRLVLDVVMAAAGNLFDLEIDLKKIAGGAQDSESGG